MEIGKDILLKHIYNAAIEQIAFDYQKNGYEVSMDTLLDEIRADLFAKKNSELIVFEFKSSKSWGKKRIEEIKQLRNYVVHERGASFRLVLVNAPGETSIEIDNLEQIIFKLVDNTHKLYDELATHIEINGISDIDLNRVAIHENETEMIGTAVINLILQYGSDSDDGLRSEQSFLLDFHIVLGWDLEIEKVHKLKLDTSDYYDPQDTVQQQIASAS